MAAPDINSVTAIVGLSPNEITAIVTKLDDFHPNNATKEAFTKEFVEEIVTSNLFKMDWPTMLQSAPLAIYSLGFCFIASTSTEKGAVILKSKDGGYKHLEYTSLNANLAKCVNLGSAAFHTAEVKLDLAASISQSMFSQVEFVMDILEDPEASARLLIPELNRLKTGAEKCQSLVNDVHTSFASWLAYVTELQEVTDDTDATMAEKLIQLNTELVIKEAQKTRQEEEIGIIEENIKEAKIYLDQYNELWKQALDEIPTAKELLHASVTLAITQALTNIATQVVSTYTGGAYTEAAKKIFSKSDQSEGGHVANSSVQENMLPQNYNDPAFSLALVAEPLINSIKSSLTATNGAPDWDDLKKVGVDTEMNMLKSLLENFSFSDKEPSEALRKIISDVVQVAQEIKIQLKSLSENPAANNPVGITPIIQNWQSVVSKAWIDVSQLSSTGKTISGAQTTAGQSSATAGISQERSQSEIELMVSNAKTKLDSAQAVLLNQQKIYHEKQTQLLEAKSAMIDIMAQLSQLMSEEANMKHIKEILNQALLQLLVLITNVENLRAFFKAIVDIVDLGMFAHAKPFLESIENITDASPTGPLFTIPKQRQRITRHALFVRGHFTVLHDISTIYTDISRKFISPGIILVRDLSHHDPSIDVNSDRTQRLAKLDKFTTDATQSITDQLHEKYQDMIDHLDEKFQAGAQAKAFLPELSGISRAIESGASVVTDAATLGIKEYKPHMLLPLPLVNRK